MSHLKRSTRCKFAALVLAIGLALGRADAQVLNNATASSPQQQQPPNSLQVHLNQIQQQVQRQLNQFNGLIMANSAANNSAASQRSNVLEAISNIGKVVHQQISAATNPNHVNIVTGGGGGLTSSQLNGPQLEFANSKKNEYQSVQMADLNPAGGSNATNPNYREQGELLRQEITRRAGQLQQVVAGSMDLLKNNGDLIMRRLLEQMNIRLDQAKAKADKIISNEPIAMNEMTVRTLATINSGLNNLNNIIANIVARIDSANKQDQHRLNQANQAPGAGLTLQQRVQQATGGEQALPQLLDTSRFRANLHQLGQQFQQALNGSSLHQQLALIRNQRLQQQQQQQLAPGASANRVNTDFTQAKQQN